MTYLIKLCFIAFTMFATNVFAINSMPLNSTAENYIEKYGSSALYIAFRQGNHQILHNHGSIASTQTEELIQVLRVFKAQPKKIDEYGDCEPSMRICASNNNLDFSALPQDLAKKVAKILGVKLI